MKLLNKRAALFAATVLLSSTNWAKEVSLLNVSYDPTRELYREFNTEFAKHWKAKTGDDVKVEQSHGGSGSQELRQAVPKLRSTKALNSFLLLTPVFSPTNLLQL